MPKIVRVAWVLTGARAGCAGVCGGGVVAAGRADGGVAGGRAAAGVAGGRAGGAATGAGAGAATGAGAAGAGAGARTTLGTDSGMVRRGMLSR